jgi:UDP-glucose 4-epimerase
MSFWSHKRVLVTSGAGFIGRRLVARLVELGADVTVVDDLSKGTKKNLEWLLDSIEFRTDNLLEHEVASNLLKDVEICFHMAARIGGIGYFHKTPAESLRDNSIIDFNLWDAARAKGVNMVCLSSSMVFEKTRQFHTPENALTFSPPPVSGYGFSKLVAEYIARTYHEQYAISYLIVRPFSAFGPGEAPGGYMGYGHVISDLVKKIFSNQYPLEILGSGKQTRSCTYVDDAADAIIFLVERFRDEDFNIGTGIETSVVELAKRIWRLCGRKEPFAVKNVLGFGHDVQKRVPDVSKIFRTGWEPKVSLDDGFDMTIKWLSSGLGRSSG